MVAFVNEEMWAIDAQPLSTWAYNIESIGGRQGIPTLAGDNYSVPYRAGEVWRSKMPASRILSLGMWVRSSDANGVTPKTATGRRAQFNENLRQLRNIFYNRERLLTVTKNVRYLNGVQAYTSEVECISNLDPTMVGPNFGKMVVDLKMTDPYWTTGAVTFNMGISPFSNVPLTNPGDDSTHRMSIVVGGTVGGASTVTLRNMSYNPPVSFTIPTPTSGSTWTVDVENFFLAQANDFSTNRQNSLSRSGPSAFWFELKKGVNQLQSDSRFGQGNINGGITIAIIYYPLYL